MITIQGFARLCGCGTPTLRYYDRVGLLKPAKVDDLTGYRYYEEEQTLLFLKIKSLQRADFSIEEIKMLLLGDDDLLLSAIDRKIAELNLKLKQIENIKSSYLQEKTDMRDMVNTFTDFMEKQINKPLLWAELGLDAVEKSVFRCRVREKLLDWLTRDREAGNETTAPLTCRDAHIMKDIMDTIESGNPDGEAMLYWITDEKHAFDGKIHSGARKIFERNDWQHVSRWIGDIRPLGSGKQYCFLFRVRADSAVNDPAFSILMLAVMAVRHDTIKCGMLCKIERSDDGLNHFVLTQLP